jgi:hypothetical protein
MNSQSRATWQNAESTTSYRRRVYFAHSNPDEAVNVNMEGRWDIISFHK